MTIPRTLAVAGLAAVTLAAAAGCNLVHDTLTDGVVQATAITEIHVDGGSGDVVVVPDPAVTGIDLRRTVRYRGTKPGETYHIDGGVVAVSTSCGDAFNNCSVSYELRIPPRGSGTGIAVTGADGSGNVRMVGVGRVDLSLGSGNLEISDAAGSVTAKAGSGNITLADIEGDLSVTASSGNVQGRDLRGATVTIRVSSGDVKLQVPGTNDVTAHTSSGNVEVTVPNATCQVTATTDSGNRSVQVSPDPASPHRLDVSTNSGDIRVKPA